MAWEYYLGSLRWLHILAGITWIGLLYYFNFVQTPSFPKLQGGSRRDAFVNLVPSALWWFRWAALVTFLAGVAWIISRGVHLGWDGYIGSASFNSIMVGGGFGIFMFLNVWLIIWPNQKKIIAANVAQTENPDAPGPDPKWASTAALASRVNTLLSVPMLFFMVAARNMPALWQ